MGNKLDLHNQHAFVTAIAPIAITDNTVLTGLTIDQQGYDALEFVVATGILADADATFAAALFEGNASDMSDETVVTDPGSLIGTAPTWSFSDDASVFSIGYQGAKRYARLKITPSANTGSAPLTAIAILRKKKIGTVL